MVSIVTSLGGVFVVSVVASLASILCGKCAVMSILSIWLYVSLDVNCQCGNICLSQCFLGDKHGIIPLPAAIAETDFLALRKHAGKSDKNNKPLLANWYQRDDSNGKTAVVYRLKALEENYESLR